MTHRPYANDPNAPPSVTTVLSLVSKPGLSWAAANETAHFAVDHLNRWAALSRDEAWNALRKHHRGLWDHRGALGTALHRVNEAWAQGGNVSLGEVVDQVQDEHRIWRRMQREEVIDELRTMVVGLSDAWVNLKPDTFAFEQVVRYDAPHLSYIGTADWRAVINGRALLVDVKTTGKDDGAFYFKDWALQLAAYRYADVAVNYERDVTYPLSPVESAAVLLVRANGEWQLLDVTAGHSEHDAFLALRQVYEWRATYDDTSHRLIAGSML